MTEITATLLMKALREIIVPYYIHVREEDTIVFVDDDLDLKLFACKLNELLSEKFDD